MCNPDNLGGELAGAAADVQFFKDSNLKKSYYDMAVQVLYNAMQSTSSDATTH